MARSWLERLLAWLAGFGPTRAGGAVSERDRRPGRQPRHDHGLDHAGDIMQGVDNTIPNVALPHIQGSLSASQDQIAWVADLLHRRRGDHDAADRLARRPVRHQIRLSGLGHRLHRSPRRCAAPPPASPQLVLFRAAAGGLRRRRWSRCRRRRCCRSTRRSGTARRWRCGASARSSGPIMGPALGGWLTEDYSWRWVFYINLPVGVLCTLGILVFIRQTRNVPSRAVRFLRLRRR